MRKISITACFISAFYFGQAQPEFAKDSVKSVGEVLINTEKKIHVNYLNIKGLEAPMSINVLDNKILEEMNITKVEDAVRNIPGIHSVNQYGAFQFFNIRGFDDFVVLNDGIRDERHTITQSAPITNLASVERIESLKGPSGEMFGHSALGGIINIVRKKPTEKFTGNGAVTIGSYNTQNYTLGLGGAIIPNKLRFRLDSGIHKTDGWRNISEKTRNVAATLQYLINNHTELELFAQHNNDYFQGDAGVPLDNFGNVIKGLDYTQSYSNPHDYTKNKRTELKLKFTHKLNNGSRLTNTLSHYDDSIDYMLDEVLFYNPNTKAINLYNGAYHFNHLTKPTSNQLDYHFSFNTGGIKHHAMAGNTISYLDRKTLYKNIIYDGVVESTYPHFSNRRPGELSKIYEIKELLIGTYFHNWIQFTDNFKTLIGLRYDSFDGTYHPRRAVDEAVTTNRDQFHNFSFRLGLSYQPVQDFMTIYGSASNFFKPTRSHNHRTNTAFLPQRGFQTEVGVKFHKKNLYNITASGFYIEKSNVIVGHNILSQVGGANSKGFELDADFTIRKNLYLKLGYAFTDARFISKGQSDENKEIIGKKNPWTPLHTANSWINYEFDHALKGLGIGAGVYFVDKAYQNQFNNQYLPAYTLANGTIYYKTKNNIRLGFNIENIFNQLYFRSALSSNDLYSEPQHQAYQSLMQGYPGRGRNFSITLSYQY